MQRTFVSLVVVLVMPTALLPWANAGVHEPLGPSWSSQGEYEPNHPADTANWMWQDAPNCRPRNIPADCDQRVYFNVFWRGAAETNPNIATTGSRFQAIGIDPVQVGQGFEAHLGVWRDCNGDGYVGAAQAALREYRTELLDAAGLQRCPSEQGTPLSTTGQHPHLWGAHHANGWVTEFIYIAGHPRQAGASEHYDQRTFTDPYALIWGDIGTPGETVQQVGPACRGLSPSPRNNPEGSFHTTGGILTLADCSLGNIPSATWNTALRRVDQPATNPLILERPGRFDQAGHPLHQPTLGDAHSDKSVVHVSDCRQPPVVRFDAGRPHGLDPTTAEGLENSGVHQPAPRVDTARLQSGDWTIAGQVNATKEESPADSCEYANDGHAGGVMGDTYDDEGHDAYFMENQIVTRATDKGKLRADMVFRFFAGNQGRGTPTAPTFPAGNNGGPTDLGLAPRRSTAAGGPYYAPDRYADDGDGQAAARVVLPRVRVGSSEPVNATGAGLYAGGASTYTFYARLGDVTEDVKRVKVGFNLGANGPIYRNVRLPSASEGVYGSEWCDTDTDWRTNGGFNCDPDSWWTQDDGTPVAGCEVNVPCELVFPRPDSPLGRYQLKDTDCYDNSVSHANRGVSEGVRTPTVTLPETEHTEETRVAEERIVVPSDGLCAIVAKR